MRNGTAYRDHSMRKQEGLWLSVLHCQLRIRVWTGAESEGASPRDGPRVPSPSLGMTIHGDER